MTDDPKARLLAAILPHVPFDGWTDRAFRRAARDAAIPEAEARLLCPRGASDLAALWHREGDREMRERLPGLAGLRLRLRERVAAAVRDRTLRGDREVLRRSLAHYALPANAAEGARLLWETADAVWEALGDTSRDGNWYTKRATLAAVVAAAALFRVGDDSPDGAATAAFVDRRIADVMAFEAWKGTAGRNPLLRPLAAPLAWAVARVRAPSDAPKGR